MLYFSHLTETYDPDGVNAVSPSAPTVFGSQHDSLLRNVNNMNNGGSYPTSVERSVLAGFDPKNGSPTYSDIVGNQTSSDIERQMAGEGTRPEDSITPAPVNKDMTLDEWYRNVVLPQTNKDEFDLEMQMRGEGDSPPNVEKKIHLDGEAF